jgi:mitochondrial fission protein ELM1
LTTLKTVFFRDGRPGHEKQSQGILRALNRYVGLDIHEVSLEANSRLNNLFAYIIYFSPFFSTSRYLPKNPDILIGSGSGTHIPLLSCKKKYGGYALTCMSPSAVIRSRFDLCFVPVHDRLTPAENIVQTIGPPNIAENRNEHDSARSMILVGGVDEHSHRWDSENIIDSIRDLLRFSENQQWTVTSSPRTPDDTEALLALLADQHANIWYVPYGKTKPGWIERQYDVHRNVWVTGDSISMVYEALTAGCSVGIIPVQWKKQENKFLYSLRYLIENRRVITLNQYLQGAICQDKSSSLNEADRCAKEILKRWWPENLP